MVKNPRQQSTTALADTNRVLLLLNLCYDVGNQDNVQALAYGQQGLLLARQLHYRTGEAYCLNALAQATFVHQDFAATARYFRQTIQLAGQAPRLARPLTEALLGMGRLAVEQDEFAEAENYFQLANKRILARTYPAQLFDFVQVRSHLATLYSGWLASGRPSPDSLAHLAHLSEYYARLALATFKQIPAAEQRSLSDKLIFCLDNMAMMHQQARRYDSALYYHRQTLQLWQRSNNTYGRIHTQQAMGEIRLFQHRWAEAVKLLRPTIAWAQQFHALVFKANGQKLLAQALDQTGSSHEAYQLARESQVLSDSLYSASQRTALARLRVQFETERQRNQVRTLTERNRRQEAEAQKQRQRLLWLGALWLAVAGGLAVSGTLAWRLRRSRELLTHQNAELVATRSEQDRLYALVAHDLRSPVEAFMGLADLLTHYAERQDTARLAGLGGRVRQSALGLRALLDNLLSWALTQRGELTPKTEPLGVAALLTEVAELYQPSAEAAEIILAVEPGVDGYVLADVNMVRAMLRNLVSNALRATPAGGSITLSATRASDSVTAIRVQDSGEGMSEEHVTQLMTAGPQPAVGRRAGLGLRLSRAFAQAQHGQLTLISHLQEGTTAVITLPTAAAPPTSPASGNEPAHWQRPARHFPFSANSTQAVEATNHAANGTTRAIDSDSAIT